jgi:CheY-like chemotaxis protein
MSHILIADDDQAHRMLLRLLLSDAGYRVTSVENGNALVQRALMAPPQLILSDLDMPGISGRVALAQLRAIPATRDIPIILLSGHDEIDRRPIAGVLAEEGATAFLGKPYAIDDPLRLVAAHLRPSAALA